MLRRRVTSLVILVVLSLFIQIDVDAHLQNTTISPSATVTVEKPAGRPNSEVDILVARASCSFRIGAHAGGENYHKHYANWFGQVYVHKIVDPNAGGSPINEPGFMPSSTKLEPYGEAELGHQTE